MANDKDDSEAAKKVSGSDNPASGGAPTPAPVEDNAPDPPKRDYEAERLATSVQPEENYASVNKRKSGFFLPNVHFVSKPEDSRAWMSCIRTTLVVFNLFIWLLGAVVTALGIWTLVDREFWDIQTNLNMTQFATASYVLIAVGVIIMLIGFIGCCGAATSRIWMLVLFSIVVGAVLLLEIVVMAIVWSKVSSSNAQEDIKAIARSAMDKMLDDDKKRYFIDLLQSKLHCCGVNGPGDYSLHVETPRPIPGSCMSENTQIPYEEGCFDAAVNYLKSKASVLGGVAVAIFLLQIAALVLTICLACSIKNTAINSIF